MVKKVSKVKVDEEKDKKIEELEGQVKRSLADYLNLEKRVLEQRQEWIRQSARAVLLKILPVLDTLMLAQKHDQSETLKVIVGQFLSALKSEGVDLIKTEGEDFNPQTMECVTTLEGENGKVLEETRPGFVLYDKVIRPAQVIVGKKGE